MKLFTLVILLLTAFTLNVTFAQEYKDSLEKENYLVDSDILNNNIIVGSDFSKIKNDGKQRLDVTDACDYCTKKECVSPANCVAGVVADRCGCCQICARTEGELCDEYPEQGRFGICGENLHCTKRKDLPTNEVVESVCACQVQKMVCGNDSITYSTICELNEEAILRGKPDKYHPQLIMEYWGPCKEAPIIITPPKDSYGPLGANLTLDCEAKGYPAPDITWKFVSSERDSISLPNDDQSVSIQMRGGPEPQMVTGWAQIMSLDPSYIGTYHCIAENTEGKVYAMASVGVYKNES